MFTGFDFALEVEQIWSMNIDGSDQHFITDAAVPTRMSRPMVGGSVSRAGPTAHCSSRTSTAGDRPDLAVDLGHLQARLGTGGQHLVVSDNSEPAADEAVNVVTVRPDGSDWTYLTHYPAGYRANTGGYSPDGQWIVFRLEGPGPGTDHVPDPA